MSLINTSEINIILLVHFMLNVTAHDEVALYLGGNSAI
jgi:hypothetical protein